MSLKPLQKEVDDWVRQFTKPYFQPLSQFARLAEELGEVARVLNYLHGDKKPKATEDYSDLEEELGDVLFTLICLANSQNIDLDQSWQKVMDKCHNRDNNRYEKK
ncbi:MAG: nucleotide pyrophosphohydrolase [bacterium]|nr:nucleotide pyrophosphohydrolase [bacterium]